MMVQFHGNRNPYGNSGWILNPFDNSLCVSVGGSDSHYIRITDIADIERPNKKRKYGKSHAIRSDKL